MKHFSKSTFGLALTAALMSFSAVAPSISHAAAKEVVIGSIDDMSGLYADVIGPKHAGRRFIKISRRV